MSKKRPDIKSDAELAQLMEGDLSAYLDGKHMHPVKFLFTPSMEDLPKTENVHVRFSKKLLAAVKKKAASSGISYQKYIRRVVESSLAEA